MAFQNYSPNLGVFGSPWVGFKHFEDFLTSFSFFRLLKNTLTISVSTLIFSFPAPIILALSINEIKSSKFAKITQTITYMPHFISVVVICGMIRDFTSDTGVITLLLKLVGVDTGVMLNHSEYFVPIYVLSGIWQEIGWGSIIYLSALAGVDQELYEAAIVDGAGRWKQTWHITIPGIMPTIVIMLVLKLGSMLSVGYEKIILLYSPVIYETADVISTYVYRKGLINMSYSFSTAVGLFNSVINFALVVASNTISKKLCDQSLW